jgi:hypothetical protein
MSLVLEHIINLTNELNSRVDPGRASLPIPRSVFEVYGERKEQQKQVIARMKRILDVADIVNFTTAETLEAGEP